MENEINNNTNIKIQYNLKRIVRFAKLSGILLFGLSLMLFIQELIFGDINLKLMLTAFCIFLPGYFLYRSGKKTEEFLNKNTNKHISEMMKSFTNLFILLSCYFVTFILFFIIHFSKIMMTILWILFVMYS